MYKGNRVSRTEPQLDPETEIWSWTETSNETGYKLTRQVTATQWVEMERTDCYCCSCDDDDLGNYVDVFCRNHGYAGERPCEVHNLPGTIDPDYTPEQTTMHDSVQEVWRKRRAVRHQ